MNQGTIEYTRCDDCCGTGKKPNDETSCTNCLGTGWVEVLEKRTLLSTPRVESSDRRRFPRYYTDVPIKLHNQQGQEFAGRCVIVAEGGLCAILPYPIPSGSVVTLQLSIATHATALKVEAIVLNRQGLRHGFKFVSLTDSEREVIRQFCAVLRIQSDDGRVDS